MTSADTEAMKALQELLEERQRYEGWMRALDERQSTTPAHVFTRVHTDYSLRLERVMLRLSERTEQVRTTVEAMSGRLTSLRSKETDRIDARQEAELRAAVGEYSDDEWTKIRDEADLEIELLAEERRGVESELAEMERILELTQPSKTPSAGPQTVSAGAVTPQASTSGVMPASAQAQTVASTTPSAEHRSEPSGATSSAPVQSTAREETPSINDFVADWPVRHVDPATAAQGDGVAEVPEVDAGRQVRAAQTNGKTSTFAPPSGDGNVADSAVETRREQEKTLKCPECSALNYATEWYCERCGGELATF